MNMQTAIRNQSNGRSHINHSVFSMTDLDMLLTRTEPMPNSINKQVAPGCGGATQQEKQAASTTEPILPPRKNNEKEPEKEPEKDPEKNPE
jgi:hypothetical protein